MIQNRIRKIKQHTSSPPSANSSLVKSSPINISRMLFLVPSSWVWYKSQEHQSAAAPKTSKKPKMNPTRWTRICRKMNQEEESGESHNHLSFLLTLAATCATITYRFVFACIFWQPQAPQSVLAATGATVIYIGSHR